MKIISRQFYNHNQSWHFERIVEERGVKLRVLIRRNAYDEQSFVRGFAFNPLAMVWNCIVDRPIITAKCKGATYCKQNEDIKPFEADCDSVLQELQAIITT